MMSSKVRVFACTYRRPQTLRRALASLLAQTFTDWICELHNDAPEDGSPSDILAELAPGDPRFLYFHHATNWGAVATFNHAFAGGPEPFAALLEDDNWWEPEFLSKTVAALESRPEAALVWTNMQLWREEANGAWIDEGKQIWRVPAPRISLVEFQWPEILQGFDALHSNGAAVFRPGSFAPPSVPARLPFAIIEPARERAARGPLLFIPETLAHFARTLQTARTNDPALWLQSKLLMAASFCANVTLDPSALRVIWNSRRAVRPRDTDFLFVLALALRRPALLRMARAAEWLHFAASTLRHPRLLARALRFRREQPDVWAWFSRQSEVLGQKVPRCALSDKHTPDALVQAAREGEFAGRPEAG